MKLKWYRQFPNPKEWKSWGKIYCKITVHKHLMNEERKMKPTKNTQSTEYLENNSTSKERSFQNRE